MSNAKYLLWDFDGTLAYRDGMWTDALYCVLQNNGVSGILKEEIRPFLNIGFTWHSPETPHCEMLNGKKWWEFYTDYFQEIYEKLGISTDISIKLAKDVRKEYLNSTKWHIYSDTEQALTKCIQAGYRNVILSNHVPELSELVNELNLDKHFYKIYSSGLIGYEKPNKKIFDYVIDNLNTEREDCIMIGDSYDADIAGALRSNIKPILVRKDNVKNYKWYCNRLENINETLSLVH